eukprot:TRINITY_DN40285_c0_g1_i1.p1 TRINITY_DN40285_c0_g1~~TRINITY_DN40285_c0_g1_i1.p1  ORF type:complete len:354 (-),score=67.41 TRINITY_DN40285_c0_g1_i1:271-1332(-)
MLGQDAMKIAVLCTSWIFVSYLLIAYNKHLMTNGGFPYAAALGMIHGVTCSSLAAITFLICPSLFTTLMDEEKRKAINAKFMMQSMLPICIAFTVEIVLSNQAYKYLSLAFLQMLKESNVVIVYLMAWAVGMERFSSTNLKIILLICFASVGTMRGELHFSLLGFAIQMLCCIVGSLKITLQGVLLSSAGMKFDALTYMVLVMPVCSLIQGSLLVVSSAITPGGTDWMPVPTFALLASKWQILLPNALLAFALNLIAVMFIKASSSVTYVLAGIVKDMVIVICGVAVSGDEVSPLQSWSFLAQLFFLMLWSAAKMNKVQFEDGVMPGLFALGKQIAQPSINYGSIDKKTSETA